MITKKAHDEWRPIAGELGRWFEVRVDGAIRNRKTKKRIKTRVVQGYRMLSTRREGKSIAAKISNILWSSFVGPIPGGHCVDHINRDSLDDRLDNYRLITLPQNRLNSCASKTRSGFKGVITRELATCTRYQARARHRDRIRVGPNRATPEEAALDRDYLLKQMLSDEDFAFCALNFPSEFGRRAVRGRSHKYLAGKSQQMIEQQEHQRSKNPISDRRNGAASVALQHKRLIEKPMSQWVSADVKLWRQVCSDPMAAATHIEVAVSNDPTLANAYGRVRAQGVTDPDKQAPIVIAILASIVRDLHRN